jgi:hypothetical protein
MAEQIAGLETHNVPGERAGLVDDTEAFFERFTKGGRQEWYSFDNGGAPCRTEQPRLGHCAMSARPPARGSYGPFPPSLYSPYLAHPG